MHSPSTGALDRAAQWEEAVLAAAATFLVIGGGASGVLTAVQLLSQTRLCRVVLIEKDAELGAGIAYGTEHHGHLLNVSAARMSAFADQPDHFTAWLSARGDEAWSGRSYAPRRLYRDYLQSLLAPYRAGGPEGGRLAEVRAEAVDIEDGPAGVAATTGDGARHLADAAILATGNESPLSCPEAWRHDCWTSRAGFDIASHAAVAIIGTGLSMVDSVVSLLDAGHTGPLTAISRRGLLPQPHVAAPPLRRELRDLPAGARPSALMRWMRRRIARDRAEGIDWRITIDSMRPYTQALWLALPARDKASFLRHARPWWASHRHRMAPAIAARIEAARASGQLVVRSGRIRALDATRSGARILLVPRSAQAEETLEVDSVIECRGGSTDVGATRNRVLRRLLERGLARADPLRLGIDVTADCAVIGAGGHASERIFAVGPLTVGAFWETVAVPDIRQQVADLASRLAVPDRPPPPA